VVGAGPVVDAGVGPILEVAPQLAAAVVDVAAGGGQRDGVLAHHVDLERAGGAAAVAAAHVAVVALLDAGLDEAVAAAGGLAGGEAGVGVDLVAVVADLDPEVDLAVAAAGGL